MHMCNKQEHFFVLHAARILISSVWITKAKEFNACEEKQEHP